MTKLEQLLENSLLAQVSLEEGLYSQVKLQLAHINVGDYPEVREMLENVKNVLETHYLRLNTELDRITARRLELLKAGQIRASSDSKDSNAYRLDESRSEIRRAQISQMLRDDYVSLNLAAMGNTLLHTTALAASAKEIADIALEHLANMTRFVMKLSDLMPKVVIQELTLQFPEVEPELGELASKNTKEAWRSPVDFS